MLDDDKADHARLDITPADVDNNAAVGHNSDEENAEDYKALESFGENINLMNSQILIFTRQTWGLETQITQFLLPKRLFL